ncbi:MAG TPA: CHASE2 domain-containing protein [Thermoanaerobaculia bacterium]|nr:CHASE2 domain-containing protein [Thermoanaerobaculia bacterium]
MPAAKAAFATLVIVTLLLAFGVADPLELPARDVVLRTLPSKPARDVIVVAVDEKSLQAFGPWPWKREVIAGLVARMQSAKAVVLDVLLTDPREGDDQLAAAMRRVPTIAVSVLDDRGEWLLPSPALRTAAIASHGNFEVDHDGILRRLASTKQSKDRALTAVAVEASSLFTGRPIPVGISISPAFRTPPREVPQVSAVDLATGHWRPATGKLVFFGPTALALGDRVLTPASSRHRPDPGVTVHAAATESLIRGETIRVVPPIVAGIIAAVLAGAIVALRDHRRRVSEIVLVVLVITTGALLLDRANLAIPFITFLLTIAVVELVFVIQEVRLGRAVAKRFAEHREHEAEAKRLLAHELKTPLASMRGLTQLLGGFELSESERQRVTSLLESEAGKLQSLVTGLLDLERLSLRDFASSTSVIDLGELASRRVEFLRASTDRPLSAVAEPGVLVRADSALIERIIDNLVSNALKYTTPSAEVAVRVRGRDGGAVLEVEDRGPGITAAERARIFDRFFRGTTAAGTQGLGLGLSFVSEIARWHGGGAEVDEANGGGTVFRIHLRRAA